MNTRPLRRLLSTEVAFLKTNSHFPLNVTIVLRLVNGPEIQSLREALCQLQRRHLLLNLGIEKHGRAYRFVLVENPPPIPLQLVKRQDEETWRREAERELNTAIPLEAPLMRAVYLPAPGECELILVFHHSVVDSRSLAMLLDDLLRLCARDSAPPRSFDPAKTGGLSLERPQFTAPFHGWALRRKLLSFFRRQFLDEWRFQRRGVATPIPEGSQNATLSLSLPVTESRRLIAAIGRKGLSLNSVLGAALLLALVKNCHSDRYGALFRAIAFADLRPYLAVEPAPADFGCFISMLRFTLPVRADSSMTSVAQDLNRQMVRAGRRGELQLFAVLSKHLVSVAMRLRKMRLGNTALSFMGPLALNPVYGTIQLEGVHAYITNNELGSSFSAFGKILFGRVELDLNYLTAEIDERTARNIAEEVQALLKSFS